MNPDELNQISMTMIAQAGTAKQLLKSILVELEETNPNQNAIDQWVGKAKQAVTTAHKAQNEAIKHSETLEYSLLFTHAQDTLMGVEENLFLVEHFSKILNSKK